MERPSLHLSLLQPPTQHCVPERSIFSTIYGTFNSARELMRLYVLDGWYIMQDNGMLLALLYTVSFIPPYQITYNACNIYPGHKHHSSPHFSLFKDQIPAGGHFFDLKFKLYLNDGEQSSLFSLPVILFYLPVIDS